MAIASFNRSRTPSPDFWKGKKVLITGHTGFKGSWLSLWLQHLGAEVFGISLQPCTSPSLFKLLKLYNNMTSVECDIRDVQSLKKHIKSISPNVIFHLAAQALVRPAYEMPVLTFETNVMGTVNVLDSIRDIESVSSAVIVTSDKVYANDGQSYPFRETDPLGGRDPYSASKAASEIAAQSYARSFLDSQGVAVSCARAGNVIGGGDWSKERLIPDAIRAWSASKTLILRQPDSIRPWQHVLEPLSAYMILAESTYNESGYFGAFNFGPDMQDHVTVGQLVSMAKENYPSALVEVNISSKDPHEESFLSLEVIKARLDLSITSKWDLAESVKRTISWYISFNKGADSHKLCLADITAFGEES